jgi:hypothetical protein
MKFTICEGAHPVNARDAEHEILNKTGVDDDDIRAEEFAGY